MAVSGTFAQSTPAAYSLVERAYLRCKMNPAALSGEDLLRAREELDNLLQLWSGSPGINLWCQELVAVACYPNQPRVECPEGTYRVLEPVNARSISRVTYEDDVASSAGGTVAFAFDDDADTVLTQGAPDGNVSVAFPQSMTIQIGGYLPGATGELDLVWESSLDGITWRTVYAPGPRTYTDRVWAWFNFENVIAGSYFRVREQGGGTIVAREIVFAWNPIEMPVAVMNRETYMAMPNKFQETPDRPVLCWIDQQRMTVFINCWPVTSNLYMHLSFYRARYIYNIGDLTNEADLPPRWQLAIVENLADKLATINPGKVEAPLRQEIAMRAMSSLRDAGDTEIPDGPIEIDYNIGGYTGSRGFGRGGR